MIAKMKEQQRIIGWREIVALPEWGVDGIVAKIDSGARTSAIHVEDVVRLKGDRVRFHLVTSRRKPFKHVLVTADVVRMTRVRSSSGHAQERYVVTTVVRIGKIRRRIELSLVGRDKMLCRMLLGRRALRGFLIDPGRKHLHDSSKRAATTPKERQ
jgi:hypothetical protein